MTEACLAVRRKSAGGSLARAVFGEFPRAATEIRHHGTATYARMAVTGGTLNVLFS